MAIKYLDSKRIRGSSVGTKDTADFEETFSSTGHTSDDTTVSGWYANDILRLKYDATNDNGYFNASGAVDILYYDLQHADALNGSNANATNWTLRFKINMTTKSGSHSDGTQFTMGLVSHTANVARDFMGIFLLQAHSSGSFVLNGTINNGYPQNFHGSDKRLGGSSQTLDLASGTDWWVDITRDGDDCITTIYEDEFTGTSYTNTQDVANIADLRYIHFGVYAGNTTFIGTIDDIKFYDGGMTQDEKATLVTAGYKSAGFDGANDNAISAGSLGISLGNNYSFGGWANPEAQSSSIGMALYMAGALYLYRLSGVWKTEGNGISITGSTDVGVDSWKHVMVNVVSGTATLYIDGVADGTDANTNSSVTISQIQMGEEGTSYEYKGNLTDWFFYSRALTTAEIASLVGGAKVSSISQTNLEANYTFDSNLNDRSSNSRHLATVTGDVTGGNTKGTSPITPTSNLPENTLFDEIDSYKTWWLTDTPSWVTKAWRGVFMGGESTSTMDYISIDTKGNATTFGSSSGNNSGIGTCSSHTRGVGSHTGSGAMNFITIATLSNTTTFGNLSASRYGTSGVDDQSRGVFAGGYDGGTSQYSTTMDYITIATAGNATAWGAAATEARNRGSGNLNNNTIGMYAGGKPASSGGTNVIDYVTVQTTGACTDYGDMVVSRSTATGTSDRVSGRGIIAGGNVAATKHDEIEYMAIGTTGAAYDFGDLTTGRTGCGGVSSDTRMCIGGGGESGGDVTKIEFITIATTGNSADFGDLTTARGTIGGIQGS